MRKCLYFALLQSSRISYFRFIAVDFTFSYMADPTESFAALCKNVRHSCVSFSQNCAMSLVREESSQVAWNVGPHTFIIESIGCTHHNINVLLDFIFRHLYPFIKFIWNIRRYISPCLRQWAHEQKKKKKFLRIILWMRVSVVVGMKKSSNNDIKWLAECEGRWCVVRRDMLIEKWNKNNTHCCFDRAKAKAKAKTVAITFVSY